MKKILFFAVLTLIMASSFAQQQPISRTIQANGQATREIVPNQIFVHIELREYEKKNTGKVDLGVIQQQFLSACKKMGLADSLVSVVSYHGYDGNNIWLQKKKKKDPNLMAGIQYQVQLEKVQQIDQLVQLLDDEATQQFYVARTSHSNIEQIKLEVQKEALQDARKKASWMCETIGEKLGHAITIYKPTELSDGAFMPMMSNRLRSADMVASDAGSTISTDFKKIKIQFEVNITFALL